MQAEGKYYRSIWLEETDSSVINVIDQQKLPFVFEVKKLHSVEDVFCAIKDMTVRGAPLIGAAGAYGIYLATLEINNHTNIRQHLSNASRYLISCRPTAINLSYGVNYVMKKLENASASLLPDEALKAAQEICEKEVDCCRQIGTHGVKLIEAISEKKKGSPVNILTHCNAGWLACIDYGTVTAPIYLAHEKGIPVHVWVDETRPLNQGARLTTWELGQAGVPYTLIVDNAGGHLMQHGMVDIVLVGSDRTTRTGDVANKIGTYLKALAAFDNKVPFYSVLPSTSFDLTISDGLKEIPIETRDPEEVTMISGMSNGKVSTFRICPENAEANNYGFDVTPAKYITGLITEKGIFNATEKDINKMFSDKIN